MVALDTIRPHLTPDFVTAFRALGKQVGYRNLGRAIAYARLPTATADKELSVTAATPEPTVSRNGQRRNGRKGTKPMYTHRGPRYPGCLRCQEAQAHRFTHKTHPLLAYSVLRPVRWNELCNNYGTAANTTRVVVNALPKRECCGEKMGITPDFTDAHHWRYQCAVDPKHQRDVEISIACSPS